MFQRIKKSDHFEEAILRCNCSSNNHVLFIASWDDGDWYFSSAPDINWSFFTRLWWGLKYIFAHSKINPYHYHDIVAFDDDMKELSEFINDNLKKEGV